MNEKPKITVLVQKAQTGDTRAFDLLVKRFQDAAVGYGAALTGNFSHGEDAAQEAFLELWRVLPALRVPEAFPAYLRLTVRKHAGRITRRKQHPFVPLNCAFGAASPENTERAVEAKETQERMRGAIRDLPENERVVILQFYFGELSLKEAADFLDVPVSTVKNRLHSARKHLKERIKKMDEMDEMGEMVTASLDAARPSKNKQFRGAVIARLTRDYYTQVRGAATIPARSLIERARAELRAALMENALDTETVCAGVKLLIWTNDFASLPELMERYMATQQLDLSETFWAKWTRVRGLALRSDAQATVDAQNELMAWLRENQARLSQIRLSVHEPFAPVGASDEAALSPDALPVFALGITEIGVHFHDAGVFDDWLALTQTALAAVPKTRANRLRRFHALRHAEHLLALYERFAEADDFLVLIRALGSEENDYETPRWSIEAHILLLRRFAGKSDRTEARQIAGEATRELAAYRARPEMQTPDRAALLQTLTHNLAAPLTGSGDFDLALPLWEQMKTANEWALFWQAECVWAALRDRSRTLALLQKAAAYRFDDELLTAFDSANGFSDVRNDAEFRAALSPASATV